MQILVTNSMRAKFRRANKIFMPPVGSARAMSAVKFERVAIWPPVIDWKWRQVSSFLIAITELLRAIDVLFKLLEPNYGFELQSKILDFLQDYYKIE